MMQNCSDGRGVRGQLFITSHRCVFIPKIMRTSRFCLQFPLDSSVSIQSSYTKTINITFNHQHSRASKSLRPLSSENLVFTGFESDVLCVHAFQKMSSIALGTNQIIAAAAAGVAVLSPFASPLAFAWGTARDLVHSATVQVVSVSLAQGVLDSEKMPKFYISHCGQEHKVKPFPPKKDADPVTVTLPTDMVAPLVLQLRGSLFGLPTFVLGRAEIVNWLPYNSGPKHKRTESHVLYNDQKEKMCQVTLSICISEAASQPKGITTTTTTTHTHTHTHTHTCSYPHVNTWHTYSAYTHV
jgi:hypothetical protein